MENRNNTHGKGSCLYKLWHGTPLPLDKTGSSKDRLVTGAWRLGELQLKAGRLWLKGIPIHPCALCLAVPLFTRGTLLSTHAHTSGTDVSFLCSFFIIKEGCDLLTGPQISVSPNG